MLYDAEIEYVDQYVDRLLDGLRKLGVYQDTLIVVTADHGELLGENGKQGHGSDLTQQELHVPQIVKLPGPTHKAERRPERVSTAGIFSLILEQIGDEVARATRDPTTGVLAGAILGLNPQFLFVSSSVSNDSAAVAASAACFAVLARTLRDGNCERRDYIAFGIASALALMVKLSAAPVLAASFALLLLLDHRALPLRLRDIAWAVRSGSRCTRRSFAGTRSTAATHWGGRP